jgi:hypothetical protein
MHMYRKQSHTWSDMIEEQRICTEGPVMFRAQRSGAVVSVLGS